MLASTLKLIIKHAKLTLFLSLILTLFLSFKALDLSVDASASSLLLEDDKDLKFYKEVSARYKNDDFIMIGVQFKDDNPFSAQSLKALLALQQSLEKIAGVERILSLLNAPLLQSSNSTDLKELLKNIPNLQSADINLSKAQVEILNSPFYQKNIISKDGKTAALIVYLSSFEASSRARNLSAENLSGKNLNTQNSDAANLNTSVADANLSTQDLNTAFLNTTNSNPKQLQNAQNTFESARLDAIRQVLTQSKSEFKGIYISGVSVIAQDMISYIKDDLLVYGVSLALLLSLVLWVFFRRVYFVALVFVICASSLLCASGIFALLGFQITVISSNYLALMLIINISLIIHILTQFINLAQTFPRATSSRLALAALLAKAKPSFYAILTTAIGFLSLIFSNIEPIIKLGVMMSIGIFVCLVLSFVIFASTMSLLKRRDLSLKEPDFGFLKFCAKLSLTRQKSIVVASFVLLFISLFGIEKLRVENSFVNYFKDSSEIKKGLLLIDKELGGTMPLEVVLKFEPKKSALNSKDTSSNDSLESFEDEFEALGKQDAYFFSASKMRLVRKVHELLENKEFIGSVLSLNSLLELGKSINEGKDLDDFALAFLYENLPENFKQDLLSPFVNIQNNELRFVMRIVDSDERLRRDAFLKELQSELDALVASDHINENVSVKLSGIMLLYNNMLQSLFESQFNTLAFVVGVIFVLFVLIFKSVKLALAALLSNVVPLSLVFALMGALGLPLDLMSITIAAICIGIGVDDSIHYIYKFKQELRHSGFEGAIYSAHRHIATALFHSKIAIILGFSVMMSSNFIPTIYFGALTDLVMILLLLSSLILLPALLSFCVKHRTKMG